MELQHINVKFFVDGELTVDQESIIKTFHRWTSDQSMPELLIDVADYRHVPAGPGVVLVGHEADYAIDNAQDQLGLLYNRKAAADGSNQDRLSQAVQAAGHACSVLEDEFGADGLKFCRQRFQLIVNDRAHAPNAPETWDACRAEIEDFVKGFTGHDEFEIVPEPDPRRRFGAVVSCSQPFELAPVASS